MELLLRWFMAVGCWFGLDLALRHDGSGAARLTLIVDSTVHDLHVLEIFLDDFFPGEFDVLFRLSAGPLADSVDHVLFHEDPNLFGQVGAGGELRDPLTDDRAFRHVPLALADEVLVRRVTGANIA
jgi:hypothetical protein